MVQNVRITGRKFKGHEINLGLWSNVNMIVGVRDTYKSIILASIANEVNGWGANVTMEGVTSKAYIKTTGRKTKGKASTDEVYYVPSNILSQVIFSDDVVAKYPQYKEYYKKTNTEAYMHMLNSCSYDTHSYYAVDRISGDTRFEKLRKCIEAVEDEILGNGCKVAVRPYQLCVVDASGNFICEIANLDMPMWQVDICFLIGVIKYTKLLKDKNLGTILIDNIGKQWSNEVYDLLLELSKNCQIILACSRVVEHLKLRAIEKQENSENVEGVYWNLIVLKRNKQEKVEAIQPKNFVSILDRK